MPSAICSTRPQMGLGQYDLSKIDIRGEKPESVKKTFKLHTTWISSWTGFPDLNKTA